MSFRKLSSYLLPLLSFFILSSCSKDSAVDPSQDVVNPTILTTFGDKNSSTEVANFVTTAIKESLDLDFAFLPSSYFKSAKYAIEVKKNMSELEIASVLKHFPKGPADQLLVGTMKGKDIQDFIFERSIESYKKDLESAGLWYDLNFEGGFLTSSRYMVKGHLELERDRYYRIAVSDHFFFGAAFPGYKFRNSFNFVFKREKYHQSIRNSIKQYLEGNYRFPYWRAKRAQVKNRIKSSLGYKRISQIQGWAHTSPIAGHQVKTKGIVTAVGSASWYPFGLDIYIQSLKEEEDQDERTSEGLHVYSTFNNVDIKLGQLIEVEGFVIEDMRANGMGQTSLRLLKPAKVIASDMELPKAIALGEDRPVPTKRISTFSGNLMRKKELNLNDGIDFWESLEGMRIKAEDLVITGLRGGGEDLIEISNRFYLNLYVYSKKSFSEDLLSDVNGLRADLTANDFNPETFVITTNHLSKGILVEKGKKEYHYYNIGDEIVGAVEGVLTYPKNIFGGGEYALVLPEPQKSMEKFLSEKEQEKIGSFESDLQKLKADLLKLEEDFKKEEQEFLTFKDSLEPPVNKEEQAPLSPDTQEASESKEKLATLEADFQKAQDKFLKSKEKLEKKISDLESKGPVQGIKSQGFVPFSKRGRVSYGESEDEVSFATFNLENLPGNRPDRIDKLGEVLALNLNCPDVVNLVEVQDDNGISFRGTASAEKTLYKILAATQARCPSKQYKFVNIDPFVQAEGGQPGGNIRVAVLYNNYKLFYEERQLKNSVGGETTVLEGGALSQNPGRILPLSEEFQGSRRSFAIEFRVRRNKQRVYMIGNHLNSKLGDIDLWGNNQPAVQNSDFERSEKALKINQFVRAIEQENPNAEIIVLGDFNALPDEKSMKTLTSSERVLRNMIFTLPANERYTTNHNGNSQALDYIFVNQKLYNKLCTESKVLHINSNFMGRISDHDPVLLNTCYE